MALNSIYNNELKSLHGTLSARSRPPITSEIVINENGIYTPSQGIDGFSKVTVNTPTPPTLDILNVTQNGNYTPETGHVFNQVNVNVPTPTHTYLTNVPFWRLYNEGSGGMNQTELNKINITWTGSSSIGYGMTSGFNLANKGYSKIIVDIDEFGESYAHLYNDNRLNFRFSVGLINVNYENYPNPETWQANNQLLAITNFNNITDYGKINLHEEITLPNNQDYIYLYCQLAGLRMSGLKIDII